MKKICVLLLIFALLFTAACGTVVPTKPVASDEPEESEPVTPPEDAAETETPAAPEESDHPESEPEPAAPRTILIAEIENEEYATDDGTLLLTTHYALPVLQSAGSDAALARMTKRLATMKQTFLEAEEEGVSSVASALEMAQQQYADDAYFGAYGMDHDFTIERADESVLSFCNIDYSYFAGAHGYTGYTGLNFDPNTGAELGLADLSNDVEALRALLLEQISAMAASSEYAGGFFEGYQDWLVNNIADGFWYFSAEGLTVIYNAYDIGPYAMGPVFFTVPYAALRGVVDAQWLPAESAADGELLGGYAEDIGGKPVCTITLDADGAALTLLAQGTVRNVTLVSVDTYDGTSYYDTATLAFVSYLNDGESLDIAYQFVGAVPHLAVRYDTAGGTVTRLISLSGEDGSVLLIDPAV